MASEFPPCPASLRQIQHYLKTAAEHETRDVIVVYWCRLFALQTALKVDKKSDEAKLLLVKLMDWLEKKKRELSDNEAIMHEIAAQAHIENYALKLFLWADNQDQNAIFNKNVVKSFYTSGMLMDVLSVFGELSEDIENKRKYAKWKAAYIHNCLKTGETPIPGPMGFDESESDDFSQPGSSGIGGGNELDSNYITLPDNPPLLQPPPEANIPPSVSNFPSAVDVQPEPSASAPSVSPQVQPSQYLPSSGVKLDPTQVQKAQKYCKWATSALNYDDIPEAISNLQKALRLLTTGEDG